MSVLIVKEKAIGPTNVGNLPQECVEEVLLTENSSIEGIKGPLADIDLLLEDSEVLLEEIEALLENKEAPLDVIKALLSVRISEKNGKKVFRRKEMRKKIKKKKDGKIKRES